jgi:nitrite reductase/ring-hydroxylating ferredoxin subunit
VRLRRRRRAAAIPAGTVDVAASADVPTSPPFRVVSVAGERLLLARHPDGHVVAFDAACPHQGQPLRKAELDGEVVTCRHHRYAYSLDDGRCVWPSGPRDEHLTLREVGEVGGRVWVRPTGTASPPDTSPDPA